jgi:hypothetical protein
MILMNLAIWRCSHFQNWIHLSKKIAHLSGYAVTSRYPSDEPDPELDEAYANYQIALDFVSEIKQLIKHLSAI